jgi:hypothetical protein
MTEQVQPEREQPEISGEQIESAELTCDIQFFASANEFAKQAIKDVPELHAIAIVPLWSPDMQNIPNGLLRLRDENSIYLPALLKMVAKMTAFSVDVHQDMLVQLRAFDRMSSDIVKEIHEKAETLEAMQKQISAQTTGA